MTGSPGMRGGEKVLEALLEIWPEAPVFTLFHAKGAFSGNRIPSDPHIVAG